MSEKNTYHSPIFRPFLSTAPMRWTTLALTAGLVLSLVAISGCAAAPPSDELQELESKLQDTKSQELRQIPNAQRFHDEARQYRRVAREAQEDRHEERSREYARLGLLRYQTAVAIYEQFQIVEELNEINSKIEEINPEVRSTTQSRNELAAELRELDQEIRQAVQEREERRLAKLQESDGGFDPGEGSGQAQHSEVLEEVNEQITRAQELRDKALEYNADEYSETRGLFGRAETQLDNARTLIQENPRSARTAKRQIGFAVQLFEEAHERAVPVHEEYVEMMRPANRISTLSDLAQANFGHQYTESEGNGVRVIMARLFQSGEEDFGHETGPMIDAMVSLADEYHEFSIQIIGFTRQEGGTTENLALSQRRAQKIQEIFVDRGIDNSRISHEGRGQDNIRFDDSPANNDRVEVILRHPDR